MAKKKCPECETLHGSRKLVCECGHAFPSRSGAGHPLVPEPGAWVLDQPRGMPQILPPAALPTGVDMTTREVQEQVAYHGLGFCVYSFILPARVKDRRLRRLWRETQDAMIRTQTYLFAETDLDED